MVPVADLSKLTTRALTAARSLGDGVLAVPVTRSGLEDQQAADALRRDWQLWKPGVELIAIHSERRALGRPLSLYVRKLSETHPNIQIAVLLPETEPDRIRQRSLRNQRGSVTARAVRRDTEAVVCRLRFRLSSTSS